MTGLMKGKRGLIMGVANDHSIAWGIAKHAAEQGAELAFTYQGEAFGRRVKPLADKIGTKLLLPCDVEDISTVDSVFETLKAEWGKIDFIVHAIGFSDRNELKGLYADTTARDRMQILAESTYNCPLVHNTNLYDRAVHILQDAGLSSDEYWVDPELQEHTVEWFWMEPCSHREALRKVVERCLGQAYADRKGIVRVEGPSFIKMPE